MKTKVFGKKIENVYEIDYKQKTIQNEHGEYIMVFTDKPTLTKTPTVREWSELCVFDGVPRYNKGTNSNFPKLSYFNFDYRDRINIAEDEEVCIDKEVFRADLNELHLFTDKVVEEDDDDRDYQMGGYETLVGEFNQQMIESNDKLKAYCKLHNLEPYRTDCIELFKLVYPDKAYVIKDGIMKVVASVLPVKACVANAVVEANVDTISTLKEYIL